MYNMFIFQKFIFFMTFAPEPLGVISRNQNIFKKLKINRNLQTVTFKMMYNMSMLRYRLSNKR